MLADDNQLTATVEKTFAKVLQDADGAAAARLLALLRADLATPLEQLQNHPAPGRVLEMMQALCELPGCKGWQTAAECALQHKDFARALILARRGYAACRDLPRARQLLIQALLANNQSAEAETLLDESLRLRFAAQE